MVYYSGWAGFVQRVFFFMNFFWNLTMVVGASVALYIVVIGGDDITGRGAIVDYFTINAIFYVVMMVGHLFLSSVAWVLSGAYFGKNNYPFSAAAMCIILSLPVAFILDCVMVALAMVARTQKV